MSKVALDTSMPNHRGRAETSMASSFPPVEKAAGAENTFLVDAS
jgi:hypothetical protein